MSSDQPAESAEANTDDLSPDDIYGMGAARRKKVEACKRKEKLQAVESVDSVEGLIDAIAAIELSWEDWVYMSPPEDLIASIRSTYESLPEDAQQHFVSDDILLKRINAARRTFNKFRGRLRRDNEMPSAVEAGPARYNYDKKEKLTEYAMDSREALDERLSKIKSGKNGARQRALDAIGSSVAEQTEKEEQSQREEMREKLERGSIIEYRNPRLQQGCVKRVNKKSVRVRRPNPHAGQKKALSDEIESEFTEDRVQLDSDHLTLLCEAALQDYGDLPNDYEEAQEHLLGELP